MNDAEKKAITVRLARIKGQVDGIAKMISDNKPWDLTLKQTKSVTSAMRGVTAAVIESRVRELLARSTGSFVAPNGDKANEIVKLLRDNAEAFT